VIVNLSLSGDMSMQSSAVFGGGFHSSELAHVGPNHRQSLGVLQRPKQKAQKFAVGCDEGNVKLYGLKKRSIREEWSATPKLLKSMPVTAISIGGPLNKREFVFVAYGATIQGLKKSGKEICLFDTQLNEQINSLYVQDSYIYMSCDYVSQVFKEFVDHGFVMNPARINNFAHCHLERDNSNSAYKMVLGCADKVVRVVEGADTLMETRLDGAATFIVKHDIESKSDIKNSFIPDGVGFVYGTNDGLVGNFFVEEDHINKGYCVKNPDNNTTSVRVLHRGDIFDAGPEGNILLGRDDGSLECWEIDVNTGVPKLNLTKQTNESITGLESGFFTAGDHPDVLMTTYSGRLTLFVPIQDTSAIQNLDDLAFSSKPKKTEKKSGGGLFGFGKKKQPEANAKAKTSKHNEDEMKSLELKKEIGLIQKKLDMAKSTYGKVSENLISVGKSFNVNSSIRIVPESRCYLISINVEKSLDLVLLQSDLPLMLIDVDRTAALVSKTMSPPEEFEKKTPNLSLYTYRVQHGKNRLELMVKAFEKQKGFITLWIMPKVDPASCQQIHYEIKPLSLHEPQDTKTLAEQLETIPYSQVAFTGNFTKQQMHNWLLKCLNGMPPNPSSDPTCVCAFTGVLFDTFLQCEYTEGSATFISDNISTVSTLLDNIMKEATAMQVNMSPSVNVNPDSVLHYLNLIKPQLEAHFQLKQSMDFMHSLEELKSHTHDSQLSFMKPEWRAMLENKQQSQEDFKHSNSQLDFLKSVVLGCYTDRQRLMGKNASMTNKITALLQGSDYSFDKLLACFEN
jgi:Bardet-Biedl syndrome 7 protein